MRDAIRCARSSKRFFAKRGALRVLSQGFKPCRPNLAETGSNGWQHLRQLRFLAWALVLMPCLVRSRPLANESAAVSDLRSITGWENDFAEAHATRGYTCELAELSPKQSERTTGGYDPSDLFGTGMKSGYKFAVFNCRTDVKTVVTHYEATAVPTEQGKTGLRAFCADQSGVIWYDPQGSAPGCLASRRQLLE